MLYSDELSAEDTKAGFERKDVENPDGIFHSNPPFTKAVVRYFDPSNRIIKVNNPQTGRPEYLHQRYGVWADDMGAEPDWHPVGGCWEDPARAVELIETGASGSSDISKIVARTPTAS